jgi:hypothetical protein
VSAGAVASLSVGAARCAVEACQLVRADIIGIELLASPER